MLIDRQLRVKTPHSSHAQVQTANKSTDGGVAELADLNALKQCGAPGAAERAGAHSR